MCSDLDIKIAGNKPSQDIKRNSADVNDSQEPKKNDLSEARELGKIVALRFIDDALNFSKTDDSNDYDMMLQRRLLLSFAATIGFELYSGGDTECGVAQKSFIDTLKRQDRDICKTSSDTGAFSFYYLAYRRGNEIDRRMGQTFAMLCSHDGDPVYQELGEALYCWFLSVVRKTAKELKLI